MNGLSTEFTAIPPNQKEFLYAVLNLPTCASSHEIRERYRSLSMIFHPDKQHGDEGRKETAAKRFLEIQKAYEVLSDPFLREVYDIFGEEGLSLNWPPDLRSRTPEEIRDVLHHTKHDQKQEKLEDIIRPRGKLSCGINAQSLFTHYSDLQSEPWYERLLFRLREIRISSFGIRHSISKSFNEKTKFNLSSRLSRGTGISGVNVLGTIRHQYSPRWSFVAATSIFPPHILSPKLSYNDNETTFTIQTDIFPSFLLLFPPPFTMSLTRRLFRQSHTEGVITCSTALNPSISVSIVTPTPFNYATLPGPSQSTPGLGPGSRTGFSTGAWFTSYEILLADVRSAIKAEWGVAFSELAVQVKLGVELGLLGLSGMFTSAWQNESSLLSAAVGIGPSGVMMRLDLGYLGQRLTLPITLSAEYDAGLALWTAVVPTTVMVVGYHLVLKPRRRAQRAAYFKAARRTLHEEDSVVHRQREETTLLLKETARKHLEAESSKGGLVVIEAKYGPTEIDEEAKDLMVDVTIPVQALVHNSQIYVPGHRSKSGIQGFYDPAPASSKSLRIRYNFRGRMHYAEIPDTIPVVLPLADHAV